MKLILAEKPSVGRDIARVLGAKKTHQGYIELNNADVVTWAIGHLVTLAQPEQYSDTYKKWSMEQLPIVPQNYKLSVVKSTATQLKIIKDLLKKTHDVIIATDAGREGELIARWILNHSKYSGSIQRLWISSLTDESIKKGFDSLQPGSAYENLYAAAEQRAIADWVIGMNATRAYTVKSNTLLTLGRVQTPTLALIVKREEQINSFKSNPFWELVVTFQKDQVTYEGKYYWLKDESVVTRFSAIEVGNRIILDIADKQNASIKEVENKLEIKLQPQFFDLTGLQKIANKKLSFTAEKTLKVLQSLYEGKYITYPRTDSSYITEDIASTLPNILRALKPTSWGKYIPEVIPDLRKNKRYTDASKVTDHHAIIPTGEIPGNLKEDEQAVYDIIVSYFIAAHHPAGKDSKTKVITSISEHEFISNGRTIIDPGWRVLFQEDDSDNEDKEALKTLPILNKNDTVQNMKQELKEGKTQPPKRYNEATLLATMETAGKDIEDLEQREIMKETGGLGTPATRSSIIEGLKRREYISLQKKNIVPTEKGINLIQLLGDHPLTSAELTGEWESLLKKIEKNEYQAEEFQKKIEQFSKDIITQVKDTEIQSHFEKKDAAIGKCPQCSGEIIERNKFYGCNQFSKGCKFTISKIILGKKISQAQVSKLLNKSKSDLIKGFEGQKGKFDAYLIYDNSSQKINFSFPSRKGK